MINIDGVVYGLSRVGIHGKDLNRFWRSEDIGVVPELKCIKDDIK